MSDPPLSPFIEGISELALWVSDLDSAVEFTPRSWASYWMMRCPKNAFLHSGSLVLALFMPVAEGNLPLAAEYLNRYGGACGGVYHIGLKMNREALDDQAERLNESGTQFAVRWFTPAVAAPTSSRIPTSISSNSPTGKPWRLVIRTGDQGLRESFAAKFFHFYSK